MAFPYIQGKGRNDKKRKEKKKKLTSTNLAFKVGTWKTVEEKQNIWYIWIDSMAPLWVGWGGLDKVFSKLD
jgi:hypothetical protein